jgi:hypothetical protein
MHFNLCISFYAFRSMHFILCISCHVFYSMHFMSCILFYAFHSMHLMSCILFYAFHSMHLMSCILFYADSLQLVDTLLTTRNMHNITYIVTYRDAIAAIKKSITIDFLLSLIFKSTQQLLRKLNFRLENVVYLQWNIFSTLISNVWPLGLPPLGTTYWAQLKYERTSSIRKVGRIFQLSFESHRKSLKKITHFDLNIYWWSKIGHCSCFLG